MQPDTILKQILFSTVRINADNLSIGTGFLFQKEISENINQMFLITNKHVIAETDSNGNILKKYETIKFTVTKIKDEKPDLGQSMEFNINLKSDPKFFCHPDPNVDLALLNISGMNDYVENGNIFIKAIPYQFIPTNKDQFDLNEDVIFVGYPNGLYDEVNMIPFLRSGKLSTPFEVNFNGNKQFIIDAQVFPGSSGSPVFIIEKKLKNGVLSLSPDKYYLMGIISKVFHRDGQGSIIQTNIPIEVNPVAFSTLTKQMIGLGICEKSNQITDLIKLYNESEGIK